MMRRRVCIWAYDAFWQALRCHSCIEAVGYKERDSTPGASVVRLCISRGLDAIGNELSNDHHALYFVVFVPLVFHRLVHARP